MKDEREKKVKNKLEELCASEKESERVGETKAGINKSPRSDHTWVTRNPIPAFPQVREQK